MDHLPRPYARGERVRTTEVPPRRGTVLEAHVAVRDAPDPLFRWYLVRLDDGAEEQFAHWTLVALH